MIFTQCRIVFTTLLLSFLISGCNTLSINDNPNNQVSSDPLESFNRRVYSFNNTVDKSLLKPVAIGYKKVVPKPAKKGIHNFFSNLREPLNAINNLLQGKLDRALGSTYRFIVNSTIGIGGLFDVAGTYDVNESKEDFGQTLAAWGVKPGPYIMLPFLGPSNLRDGLGFATDNGIYFPNNEITSSAAQSSVLTVLGIVDTRAGLLGADAFLEKQLDPYSFLKVAFEEGRLNSIYDGQPPKKDEEDYDF